MSNWIPNVRLIRVPGSLKPNHRVAVLAGGGMQGTDHGEYDDKGSHGTSPRQGDAISHMFANGGEKTTGIAKTVW